MRSRWILAIALVGAGLLGCLAHHDHASMTAPLLGDGEAVALLEKRCSACHSTDLIYSSVGTAGEWSAVVHRMAYHHKAKLLTHLTDDEAAAIARWLAESQKPSAAGVRIGYRPTQRPL
jgi:mono/diheme cytochrome c family protein